jgi:hypothetical protein
LTAEESEVLFRYVAGVWRNAESDYLLYGNDDVVDVRTLVSSVSTSPYHRRFLAYHGSQFDQRFIDFVRTIALEKGYDDI